MLFLLMKTEHSKVRHEGSSLELIDLLFCDYVREAIFSFVDWPLKLGLEELLHILNLIQRFVDLQGWFTLLLLW